MRSALLLAVMVTAGCASESRETSPQSSAIGLDDLETATLEAGGSNAVDHASPRDAALAYVASTDTLMAHSSIGRAEILGSMLTPAAARGQLRALDDAVEQLAITLDLPVERLVWVEAPLTAIVQDRNETSAVVDVWTVSVLGAPDAGSPQEVWRTVHVELVLADGRWLVSSATANAGPTPTNNELALQSGWDEFEVVAGWEPVVRGVDLVGGGR